MLYEVMSFSLTCCAFESAGGLYLCYQACNCLIC